MTAALTAARGNRQREFVRELLMGRPVHTLAYDLRGRATRYYGRYLDSTYAVVERLRALGFNVVETPGPKGGRYSATYRLV